MFDNILQDFIVLWVVIDPIGTVPVFIGHTTGLSKPEKNQVALRATVAAFFVLLFFLMFGQLIFQAMRIDLDAFQIAGGLILFYFAYTMIFGESKVDSERNLSSKRLDVAIFPLAVPSLASPGAMMAVVLLTDNSSFSFIEQFNTVVDMVVVLGISFILLRLAGKIHDWIGDAGAAIISRVMGLILASVAVDNILSGIIDYFGI